MIYEHRQFVIPEYMRQALTDWVERGYCGDFLMAVASNDLAEACARADDQNIQALPAYMAWFYNYAPAACWGSRAKALAWQTAKQQEHLCKPTTL